MPLFWKSAPAERDRREYNKTSDHWDQPSLADKITEAVNGGLFLMDELQEWAREQGYSDRTFTQTVSNLRMDGVIDTHCGGIYPTDDLGDYWPEGA